MHPKLVTPTNAPQRIYLTVPQTEGNQGKNVFGRASVVMCLWKGEGVCVLEWICLLLYVENVTGKKMSWVGEDCQGG